MFGSRDPVDQALGCVRELGREDRAGWTSEALSDRVRQLAGLAERVDAELVRCVGQWDAQQAWAADGALSPATWLGSRVSMTRQAAQRLVRAARLAFRYERTGSALAAGDVSTTAVETIATYAMPQEARYADHEHDLVEFAGTLHADDLILAMRSWRTAADDTADRRDPFAAYERRHLTLTDTFGGVDVAGFLDPEAGQLVRAALATFDRPDPTDGPVAPRSVAQRCADNLVDLARTRLAHSADPGEGEGESAARDLPIVDLDVVLDLHRLPAFSGERPGLAGDVAGACAALDAVVGGSHSIGRQPVSTATIERLACDCAVTRIVCAGRSRVLDVGRTTRVLTRAQRRALRRRDRHCRFPGYDRPPERTDAHHLVHWIEGGTTDLDNLVLLCRRHHVLVHEGGWILTRDADGAIVAAPPDPDRHPPRPGGTQRRRLRGPPGYTLAA